MVDHRPALVDKIRLPLTPRDADGLVPAADEPRHEVRTDVPRASNHGNVHYFFFSWLPSKVVTCARISPFCVTYASAPRYGAARKSAFARHWTLTVSPTIWICSDSKVNPHSPPSLN